MGDFFMKSKLLISLLLLLSPVSLVVAQLDLKENISQFSFRLDDYGRPTWLHKEASARRPMPVDMSFVSKHLSPGMMQAFMNHVGQDTQKTAIGYHMYQSMQKNIQPVMSAVASTVKAPKTDYSKLPVSLKTKVNPKLDVTRYLNASRQEAAFCANMANALSNKALTASAAKSALPKASALTAIPAIDSINVGTKVSSSAISYNLKAGQALGGALETSIKKIGTNATGALCLTAGAATVGAASYGLNKLDAYMNPKVETPGYFERAKLAFSKGYKLANENKVKSVGAVAAVAALGLVAYKAYQNSDAIFGQSKAVKAPVAKTPVASVVRKWKRPRD